MRHHFLVCYDIASPRRLRKVHKIVRDFGQALQYSVFACILSATEQALLTAKLLQAINQDEDQVLFVRLGPANRGRAVPNASTLGLPLPRQFGDTLVE